MSINDTAWAYTVDLIASPKAVLLALAFCRNGKTGRCFPSQQELVAMTGLSPATVRRSLGDLVEAKLITRTKTVKGRYRSNDEYQLNHDYEPAEVPVTMSAAHHATKRCSP
ncbi:helix-turn-helix domain-containing protein [Salinibacterium sp. G-O1]|uniref:helix-turn-helix domain-containing protein n=1 Tax=Salinibacterium sp. G-O1 TaxID=3046208 RepID=UPI0024BB2AF5|nr:helix-turn-helix domain-containing protein [Salinibacterium sp. G-O1]MDJ0336427.1 helix-turn-helix domain-containing protein [Salinibacterium sp. G-O1]